VQRKAKEKGFDDLNLHHRDVYVLLSERRHAGVPIGIDSEANLRIPTTHPPHGAVGFLFFAVNHYGSSLKRAPVAKRLTRRSAKPVYVGSNPARCSKTFTEKAGWASPGGVFSAGGADLFWQGAAAFSVASIAEPE
jgi:hypothetical protein